MEQQPGGAWVLAIVDKVGMLIASWEALGNKLNPELLGEQFVMAVRSLSNTIGKWGVELAELEASIGVPLFTLEDPIMTTSFSYLI